MNTERLERHYFALLTPDGAGVTPRSVGTRYALQLDENIDLDTFVKKIKSYPDIVNDYRATEYYGKCCEGCTVYHFQPGEKAGS